MGDAYTNGIPKHLPRLIALTRTDEVLGYPPAREPAG